MRSDRLDAEATVLRAAVRDLNRPSWATPIPRPLRARLVAFAARAQAAGWGGAMVAQAVGVSLGSLRNWECASNPVAVVPVEVTPPFALGSTGTLRLVAPTGHQLEGLDVPTAVAVLRALG